MSTLEEDAAQNWRSRKNGAEWSDILAMCRVLEESGAKPSDALRVLAPDYTPKQLVAFSEYMGRAALEWRAKL